MITVAMQQVSNVDPSVFDRRTQFKGAKGAVFVGERLLLYRRDGGAPIFSNHIDVPGGGREGRESPFETFRRELNEEFGLELKPRQVVHCVIYPDQKDPTQIGYFLVAKLPSEAEEHIVFGDEGEAYFLMDVNEFLGRTDAWPVFQRHTAEYIELIERRELN